MPILRQSSDGERALTDGEQKKSPILSWSCRKARRNIRSGAGEAEQKIAEAEGKLAENVREDLAELKEPEWYVLDRGSIQTYVEYEQDAMRIDAIGKVFPAIFFLVAALVCLTTMTRMVEENRTQVGTFEGPWLREDSHCGKIHRICVFSQSSAGRTWRSCSGTETASGGDAIDAYGIPVYQSAQSLKSHLWRTFLLFHRHCSRGNYSGSALCLFPSRTEGSAGSADASGGAKKWKAGFP